MPASLASPGQSLRAQTPPFGVFARKMFALPESIIEESIESQQREGGKLGGRLVREGYLKPGQVFEVLAEQAEWVARLHSGDLNSGRFPVATPFSLCMPCYNEAEVIEDWLQTCLAILPAFLDEFEIVVVDDGSADGTGDAVQRVVEKDARVRLVRHPENKGYGAAVTTALRACEGELICMVDGDGQFNLLDLPRLLVKAQESDVVIGYRFERADTRIRKLNAKSWNQLIRLLLGVRVNDLDCAFKLFPRWVVEQFQLTSQGACISAEMVVQCVRGGLSISQVPVNHHPRYHGAATGANLKVVAKAFRELPTLMRYRSSPPLQRIDPSENGNARPRLGLQKEPGLQKGPDLPREPVPVAWDESEYPAELADSQPR